MKGVVFTEYLQFLEQEQGYDIVDKVLSQAQLQSGGVYTAVGSYDTSEMVELLTKTSQQLQVGVDELLNQFGHHLFVYFANHYPSFFEGISDPFDFLSTIDNKIHVEVRKLYADAELPKFITEYHDEKEMVLIYESSRRLGDLATGLIDACMLHFTTPYEMNKEVLDDHGERIRFRLYKNP
jgi:hypothetical protein